MLDWSQSLTIIFILSCFFSCLIDLECNRSTRYDINGENKQLRDWLMNWIFFKFFWLGPPGAHGLPGLQGKLLCRFKQKTFHKNFKWNEINFSWKFNFVIGTLSDWIQLIFHLKWNIDFYFGIYKESFWYYFMKIVGNFHSNSIHLHDTINVANFCDILGLL